jgi:diadenosine tetraphosphate (Ap4A) HIT family hydrolase
VQAVVWRLVARVRGSLLHDLHPDGFNIGINDGVSAGQTVPHAHVHLIPRWVMCQIPVAACAG